MSDKTMLQRYAGKPGPGADPAEPEADAAADLVAFGWLRGVREFARMLELRRKDGSIVAVAYGYLDRVAFNPSDGITLSFGSQDIRIRGRNLNTEIRPGVSLFGGIVRNRVPWVQEATRPDRMEADPKAVITRQHRCGETVSHRCAGKNDPHPGITCLLMRRALSGLPQGPVG